MHPLLEMGVFYADTGIRYYLSSLTYTIECIAPQLGTHVVRCGVLAVRTGGIDAVTRKQLRTTCRHRLRHLLLSVISHIHYEAHCALSVNSCIHYYKTPCATAWHGGAGGNPGGADPPQPHKLKKATI